MLWVIDHKWNEEYAAGKKGIKMGDFRRALKNYLRLTLKMRPVKSRVTDQPNNYTSPYVFIRILDSYETYKDYINKTRKSIKDITETLKEAKISN